MIRVLRAFAWLRWRMFVNSFEQTGARDVVERFSLAIEKLGPVLAAVLMIPSAIALMVVGVAAGFTLARQGTGILFEVSRYVLLIVPVLAIVGPLVMPAADRTNPVRLLLLPISGATLYTAQAASAIADPWIVLGIPLLAGIPLGLAAGGAVVGAAVALVAGLALLAVVIGLSAVSTTLLHLAMRDRRRGEILALIFVVVLPLVGMLPGVLEGSGFGRERRERRPQAGERPVAEWFVRVGPRAFQALPSELYVRATRDAAAGAVVASLPRTFALGVTAVVLHGLGFLAFRRVLGSPAASGARRSTPMRAMWARRLPGLSPAASAVALAHVRLALRAPRGRAIMLTPVAVFALFAMVLLRSRQGMDFGAWTLQSGLGLAAFSCFMSVMSSLPMAFNQFAVDGAGLTLSFLSPLSDREYLAGKAVGNGLVVLPATLACLAGSYALFPGGPGALWLSIPLSMIAIYVLVTPVAAILSAIFPRQVDMNSIGSKSNAHGVGGLIGLLSFVLAGVPCLLLVLAATRLLRQPPLAPVLLLAWCGLVSLVARVLYIPAQRIFAARRENLALVV